MSIDYVATKQEHVIVRNDEGFKAYIVAVEGQTVSTGQPYMDVYDTIEELIAVHGEAITLPTAIVKGDSDNG
jgi:hypothetical protein